MMLLSKNKFEYIIFKGHKLAENWENSHYIVGYLLQIREIIADMATHFTILGA